MASAPRTVGIIGLGFGRAHIPAFQSQGCEVVAVCQRDQKVAREIATRYGVSGVFERWQDMLEQTRPDIVVIASPPAIHRDIAVAALEAGAHVLCEKPLAMTAEEGREMIAAAQRTKRTAMTSFNWRYIAAMQRLHTMAEAYGAVGRRAKEPAEVGKLIADAIQMDRPVMIEVPVGRMARPVFFSPLKTLPRYQH